MVNKLDERLNENGNKLMRLCRIRNEFLNRIWEDMWIWRDEKIDSYTVKSAYMKLKKI